MYLGSCSVSNDVVSNGLFQKRKYTKGWYHEKHLGGFNIKSNANETFSTFNDLELDSNENLIADNVMINNEVETNSFSISETTNENGIVKISKKVIEIRQKMFNALKPKTKLQLLEFQSEPKTKEDFEQAARDSYRKAWIATLVSITASICFIILLQVGYIQLHLIGAAFLAIISVVTYILMFYYLIETITNLIGYKANSEGFTNAVEGLNTIAYLHFLVGSLFMILLMFIPWIVLGFQTRKARKKYEK